jgi:hypothetical protein
MKRMAALLGVVGLLAAAVPATAGADSGPPIGSGIIPSLPIPFCGC